MAAKTPATSGPPTTFVRHSQVRGGPVSGTNTYVGNGTTYTRDANLAGTVVGDLRLVIEYFSDIDDADTWDTGYGSRLKAAAWQPDDIDSDFVSAAVGAGGVVTFQCDAGTGTENYSGWCWILVEANPSNDVPRNGRDLG